MAGEILICTPVRTGNRQGGRSSGRSENLVPGIVLCAGGADSAAINIPQRAHSSGFRAGRSLSTLFQLLKVDGHENVGVICRAGCSATWSIRTGHHVDLMRLRRTQDQLFHAPGGHRDEGKRRRAKKGGVADRGCATRKSS